MDAKSQVDEKHLLTLYRLLVRIDQWWISEFEIPINSDFDGEEIDPSGIQSGMMVLLRYVISTVFDVEVTEISGSGPCQGQPWVARGTSPLYYTNRL
jgi:hypothetical protein